MKTFQIKAALASGLAHRLRTLDAQVVVDTVKVDPIRAVKTNLGIADKIDLANSNFMTAVKDTESKKRVIFDELKAKFLADSASLPAEESQKMGRDLTAEYNKQAAEIQKLSTANPEEVVTVSLSDEDYETILMPVFKKTVQLWDVNGDGNGQSMFIAVADALETVVDA